MEKSRRIFIKNFGRAVMAALLALVAFSLSGKISSGKNCRTCPGNNICHGEQDCSMFLSEK